MVPCQKDEVVDMIREDLRDIKTDVRETKVKVLDLHTRLVNLETKAAIIGGSSGLAVTSALYLIGKLMKW